MFNKQGEHIIQLAIRSMGDFLKVNVNFLQAMFLFWSPIIEFLVVFVIEGAENEDNQNMSKILILYYEINVRVSRVYLR